MIIPVDVSLAVLADAANLSQEGKLNILGVFDIIYVRKIPGIHPSLQLVIRFVAKASERDTTRKSTIKLWDEDGNESLTLTADIAIPNRPGVEDITIVSNIGLSNVKFDHAGNYTFKILINDEEKREIPFKVVLRE